MRRFILISILTAVCCGCLVSCNEKPKHYRFVKVTTDGKEEVEQLDAADDTVALNLYMKKMEEILVNSIGKQEESPYKAMFIISPNGDTLNTNEELLKKVVKAAPMPRELEEVKAEPAEPQQ
jgi:hypothetical protein